MRVRDLISSDLAIKVSLPIFERDVEIGTMVGLPFITTIARLEKKGWLETAASVDNEMSATMERTVGGRRAAVKLSYAQGGFTAILHKAQS